MAVMQEKRAMLPGMPSQAAAMLDRPASRPALLLRDIPASIPIPLRYAGTESIIAATDRTSESAGKKQTQKPPSKMDSASSSAAPAAAFGTASVALFAAMAVSAMEGSIAGVVLAGSFGIMLLAATIFYAESRN